MNAHLSARSCFYLLLFQLLLNVCLSESHINVSSPDAVLQVQVTYSNSEKLKFGVLMNGISILEESDLAIGGYGKLSNGGLIFTGRKSNYDCSPSEIKNIEGPLQKADDYERLWGFKKHVENRFSELILFVTFGVCGDGNIYLRVFNDGFAFKSDLESSPFVFNMKQEINYRFPNSFDIHGWAANGWKTYIGPEALSHLGQAKSDSVFDAITPITLQLASKENTLHLAFHEANLSTEGVDTQTNSNHELTFTSWQPKSRNKALSTSWKTVIVSESAAGLVQSNLIQNLNEPEYTELSLFNRSFKDWVKPGISMWDFRIREAKAPDGLVYDVNEETFKRLIDFCADHGIDYLTIDDGWYDKTLGKLKRVNPINLSILNVPKITAYAQERGVRVILYIVHSALTINPESILSTYKSWGVAGIKHGFVVYGSESKVNYPLLYSEMRNIIEICAKYELVYSVHEPPKPSGWERTYPHFLSSEFTASMLDAPSKRYATTAKELVTIPYLHHLVAPVDRSPGMFALDTYIERKNCFRQLPSTVMSQLAQGFLYYSGIWVLIDTPEGYMAKPVLLDLMKNMARFLSPDESFIEGEIGSSFIVTKRLGQEYMTCGLTAIAEQVQYDLAAFIPIENDVIISGFLYTDGYADGEFSSLGKEVPSDSEKKLIAKDKTRREMYQVSQIEIKVQGGNFRPTSLFPVNINRGGGFCAHFVVSGANQIEM